MKQDGVTFNYPRSIPIFLFTGACFFTIFAIEAFVQNKHFDSWKLLGISIIIFLIIEGTYLFSYKIILTKDLLCVSSIFQKKNVRLSSIDNIAVYKGLKTNWIDLKSRNRVLYRIRDTITGYPTFVREMVDVLGSEVPIVAKDKYGNESRVSKDSGLDDFI